MSRRLNKFAAIVSAIILFLFCLPFFFWPYENPYIMACLSILLIIILYINIDKEELTKGRSLFSLLLLLLCSFFYMFVSKRNPLSYFIILPSLLIPFTKNNKEIYNYFVTIYCFFLTLSLISFFLAMIGVLSPYSSISPRNEDKKTICYVFPFMISESIPVERFYGPFDEPGVVGTLSGILLCLEKPRINSWKYIIILLSGICSMSFFFYIVAAVYFIVNSLFKQITIKKILLLASIMSLSVYLITTVPILEEKVASRFEWDAEDGLSGDDRIDYVLVGYILSTIGNRQLLLGVDDKEYYAELTLGSSSIFNVVIQYGVIFTTWYLLWFIIYGYSKSSNVSSFLFYLFVFVGFMYQRPYLFHPEYALLFVLLANKDKVFQLECG